MPPEPKKRPETLGDIAKTAYYYATHGSFEKAADLYEQALELATKSNPAPPIDPYQIKLLKKNLEQARHDAKEKAEGHLDIVRVSNGLVRCYD